nr:keratin, type I cytoskeletal 9-like [Penaeus vannamei]
MAGLPLDQCGLGGNGGSSGSSGGYGGSSTGSSGGIGGIGGSGGSSAGYGGIFYWIKWWISGLGGISGSGGGSGGYGGSSGGSSGGVGGSVEAAVDMAGLPLDQVELRWIWRFFGGSSESGSSTGSSGGIGGIGGSGGSSAGYGGSSTGLSGGLGGIGASGGSSTGYGGSSTGSIGGIGGIGGSGGSGTGYGGSSGGSMPSDQAITVRQSQCDSSLHVILLQGLGISLSVISYMTRGKRVQSALGRGKGVYTTSGQWRLMVLEHTAHQSRGMVVKDGINNRQQFARSRCINSPTFSTIQYVASTCHVRNGCNSGS